MGRVHDRCSALGVCETRSTRRLGGNILPWKGLCRSFYASRVRQSEAEIVLPSAVDFTFCGMEEHQPFCASCVCQFEGVVGFLGGGVRNISFSNMEVHLLFCASCLCTEVWRTRKMKSSFCSVEVHLLFLLLVYSCLEKEKDKNYLSAVWKFICCSVLFVYCSSE